MARYLGPIKWLGGIGLGAILFGLVFQVIILGGISEEARKAVLLNAIPFFAVFIGILLLFILSIVLTAMRYNGKLPHRTHSSIEMTIVVGILFGVVCLFQPFSFVPYRYGFLLVLISTLSFILWSHIVPAHARLTAQLPAFSTRANVVGAVAGLIVLVVVVAGMTSVNAPRPPYGLRERVWNSYDDERKASVEAEALQSFNGVEFPFLIVFGLFPAAVVFFAAREVAADTPESASAAVPAGVVA
ncbi:MAG: hypothetical protein H7X77_10350 [Anaerolineae bacterium]|nr:hypothetical protein [Anaerolineae bacterium]